MGMKLEGEDGPMPLGAPASRPSRPAADFPAPGHFRLRSIRPAPNSCRFPARRGLQSAVPDYASRRSAFRTLNSYWIGSSFRLSMDLWAGSPPALWLQAIPRSPPGSRHGPRLRKERGLSPNPEQASTNSFSPTTPRSLDLSPSCLTFPRSLWAGGSRTPSVSRCATLM